MYIFVVLNNPYVSNNPNKCDYLPQVTLLADS